MTKIKEKISHCDVKTNRHEYIGGSDIAAIMGLSRWKTPLKLWLEKTQKTPAPDLSDNEAVELGTELEDFVAKKFSRLTGKAVRRSPKMYQHPQYQYMRAHIDRLVTGSDELLECKTCSAFKLQEWEGDEIPQEYILQVIWYLGITGRKRAWIACLIGGQKFVYKSVEFDPELFELMVEAAKDFWNCVLTDTPPMILADDNETMKSLYPTANDNIVDLTAEPEAEETINRIVKKLEGFKKIIYSLEKSKDEIEAKLKDVINENSGISTAKWNITWRTQNKKDFDKKAFMEANPDLYAEFETVSSTRVLRIKEIKEVA